MPLVMANSLGQVTLNSSSILTTGVPVTVANAQTSAPPKLLIQALPTVLPGSSKAGEKITIITIPANQLATLMQANQPGQPLTTQLLQAKTVVKASGTQPGTPQGAAGRPAPQLILAKPAAVAQPLPQLSVRVASAAPAPSQPKAPAAPSHSEGAPPLQSPPAAPAEPPPS